MREIPREQVLKRISIENPWWEEPHQLPRAFSSMQPRPYLSLFMPLVQTDVRRAVVLMGPRRVGKTVLLHHAIGELLGRGVPPRQIAYFSVDHPIYNGLSLDTFLDHYREASGWKEEDGMAYVFFDEIQYLREWERHLKAIVDGAPGIQAIASGSAAAALRLGSAESGAGRFTDFLLPPLTFHEYLALIGVDGALVAPTDSASTASDYEFVDPAELDRHFVNYLNYGGYPEAALSPQIQEDPGRFIKSDIIDKVLLRDLPSLYGIQDVQELNCLFTTLAFNTAQEVSLEQLSHGRGIAKNTIKRYIEYLEAAFLIKVVHRVDRNARRFERATTFKVYLTNPSIRCALFAALEEDDPQMGSLVETAVFAQWFHRPEMQLHYARWKSGEVDIVWLRGDQSVGFALEVKWTDRHVTRPGELRALVSFCHANSLSTAVATTRSTGGETLIQGVTVRFHRASQYCYSLGRDIIESKKYF